MTNRTINTAHGTFTITETGPCLWRDGDGEHTVAFTGDRDERGTFEVREPGCAWGIDPEGGCCWVSERWDQKARHTFPPRMVRA